MKGDKVVDGGWRQYSVSDGECIWFFFVNRRSWLRVLVRMYGRKGERRVRTRREARGGRE